MEILELRGFDLLQARYNQITEDDGNEMFLIVLREGGYVLFDIQLDAWCLIH